MDEFSKAVSEIDERTGWVNDENVIESRDDKDIFDYSPNSRQLMTCTLTRKKWTNKIMNYAEKYPDEVKICHINKDGSIVAHIPVSYFKISRPREVSEELRERAREQMKRLREDNLI